MNRGIVFAIAAAALFGVSTPMAKLLLGSVTPLLLAGLLYTGSGVGLFLVFVVRLLLVSNATPINLPRRGDWGWLAAAAAFGGVAGPVALMYGLASIAASAASLLLNLEAVFTALLAWSLFRENYDRRVACGMLSIVAGGLVLAWEPGQSVRFSVGALLVAIACLFWALDNNLTRKVSASDAVAIASIKGLVAGTVNVVLALMLGAILPSGAVVGSAALVGLFGYGVSLVLYVLALRHLGGARAGGYFSVAPFFGAIVAVGLQGEPVSGQLVAAGILMAVGVWLHVTEQHVHVHVHEAQEHTHSHWHDEHHQHTHEAWDGREPHMHSHVHKPLVHAHEHYPDVHHRHPH